jgi:hypothetical protein
MAVVWRIPGLHDTTRWWRALWYSCALTCSPGLGSRMLQPVFIFWPGDMEGILWGICLAEEKKSSRYWCQQFFSRVAHPIVEPSGAQHGSCTWASNQYWVSYFEINVYKWELLELLVLFGHKLGDLKQHTFIFLQFLRGDVKKPVSPCQSEGVGRACSSRRL